MFDFLIKKKIKSALRNLAERKHILHNMDTIKKVLILFNYEDWDQIKDIVNDLEGKDKEVLLWTVQPKESEVSTAIKPQYPKLRIIDHKDISRIKGLSDNVCKEFQALLYDTLLDLTSETDNTFLYLLANNTSDFCIGIREPEYKVYDFIILKEDDKNLFETYNQIKIYLKNIR